MLPIVWCSFSHRLTLLELNPLAVWLQQDFPCYTRHYSRKLDSSQSLSHAYMDASDKSITETWLCCQHTVIYTLSLHSPPLIQHNLTATPHTINI